MLAACASLPAWRPWSRSPVALRAVPYRRLVAAGRPTRRRELRSSHALALRTRPRPDREPRIRSGVLRPQRPGRALERRVTVRVRLFAGLRERAGWSQREVDAQSVAEVWDALGLGDEPNGLLYAVNKEYATRDRALVDGDEVALIPPVSGGAFLLSEEPLSLDRAVGPLRALRGRDPPPCRPRRNRGDLGRDRRLGPAPPGRARGVQGRDRRAEGARATLEERGVRGRRGMDREGLVSDQDWEREYEPIQPRGTDWKERLKRIIGPIVAVGILLGKWTFVLVKFSSIFIALA